MCVCVLGGAWVVSVVELTAAVQANYKLHEESWGITRPALSISARPPPPPPPPLSSQIGLGAGHTESAWAQRLPAALDFLLAPWWGDAAAHHAQHLFFTSPAKLQAGQPAVLFVNQGVSHPLAGKPAPLRVRLGFNNWKVGVAELELRPAPQLEAGQAPASKPDEAASDGDSVRGGGAGRPLLAAIESSEDGASAPPAGRRLLAASAAHPAESAVPSAAEAAAAAMPKWQAVPFVVPEKAYEMKFVLTDGDGAWDNNGGGPGSCAPAVLARHRCLVARLALPEAHDAAWPPAALITPPLSGACRPAGSDFYVRVKLPPAGPAAGQSASEARAAAAAAAAAPADEVAARSASKLFFTLPEVLVAGAPGRLFLNRACSPALKSSPNLKVRNSKGLLLAATGPCCGRGAVQGSVPLLLPPLVATVCPSAACQQRRDATETG